MSPMMVWRGEGGRRLVRQVGRPAWGGGWGGLLLGVLLMAGWPTPAQAQEGGAPAQLRDSRRGAQTVPAALQQRVPRPSEVRAGGALVVFTVNAAYDDPDINPGDGVCDNGFTVTGGAAECSLRAAIQEANATSGFGAIVFEFDIVQGPAGSYDGTNDVWTIQPNLGASGSQGPLPALTRTNVEVAGTTQPGATGFPDPECLSLKAGQSHTLNVILDGSLLAETSDSPAPVDNGLTVASSAVATEINGLVVQNFPDYGVWIDAGESRVDCVYLGTSRTGTAAAPNGGGSEGGGVMYDGGGDHNVFNSLISGNDGVGVKVGSDAGPFVDIYDNLIGTRVGGTIALGNSVGVLVEGDGVGVYGNLVSGNSGVGVNISLFSSASNVTVQGNYVGTNLAGTAAVANGTAGISAYGTNIQIGGTTASGRNIVSGNGTFGLNVGSGTTAQGNYVGTNAAGTAAVANGASGIRVFDDGAILGGTAGTTPGGACTGACNLVSGNTDEGMEITTDFSAVDDVTVQGNYVGTDVSGTAALPNGGHGIFLRGRDGLIGGTTPAARNIVSGNGGSGIVLEKLGTGSFTVFNLVQGNYIGTNAAGTAAVPNSGSGIVLEGADSNTLGGMAAAARNVISGNAQHGIHLTSLNAEQNIIQGNYIGTNASGTSAVANGASGIRDEGGRSEIGGTAAGAGNVISGNAQDGVLLNPTSFSGSTHVRGNYIGTNASGSAAVPNGASGIRLLRGAFIGDAADLAGGRNVISGNTLHGVHADGGTPRLYGNYIGLNAAGTAALGNGQSGVFVESAAQVYAGNVISANGTHGVHVGTAGFSQIRGSYLGTDPSGTTDMGNGGHGVLVESSDVEVGGVGTGEGNIIAFNGGDGVEVAGGTDTFILGNSLHDNAGLGIDLVGGTETTEGATINDGNDSDTGPNDLQNYPILDPLTNGGGATMTLAFSLSSTPSTDFRIELFRSPSKDPSDFGEGRTLVFTTDVTTNASGTASYSAPVPGSFFPAGTYVTATATRIHSSGSGFESTSEFSPAVLVGGTPPMSVTVDVTVLLEGPYDTGTGLMSTTLRDGGFLPTTDPYSLGGSNASPPATTVDWVAVELRDASSPTTVVGTAQPGLLRADGSVVAADGTSLPSFGVSAGHYYVVVRHRNHLAAMSGTAADCSAGTCAWDFTPAQTAAYGTNPMADLGGGAYGLVAGDGNGTGDITASDLNNVWRPENGSGGYLDGDFNLTGDVTATDANSYWRPNNGRGSGVPQN